MWRIDRALKFCSQVSPDRSRYRFRFLSFLLTKAQYSGLAGWTDSTIPPVCPSQRPENDSVFKIGALDIAGLEIRQNFSEKWFFFRDEAADVWDALDGFASDDGQNGLDIIGSPGVGKSCEVWAWLNCQHARNKTQIFALWVHLYFDTAPKCVILKEDGLIWNYFSYEDANTLLRTVEVKFIVLDGYRSTDDIRIKALKESAYLNLRSGRKMKIIAVMSLAYTRSAADNLALGIKTIEVGPWTLDEQIQACRDPNFLMSVKEKLENQGGSLDADGVADLVQRKHYYAGGNARWMFALSHEEMLDDIHFHLDNVPNMHELLQRHVGVRSSQSKNHLMIKYRSKRSKRTFDVFLASKYVASRLLKACEASIFRMAYDMASVHENPAFLGWIVEFDFISQLKSCEENGQFEFVDANKVKNGFVWHVPAVIDFNPDIDFEISAMPLGTWLKPEKWNQEGYDLTGLFCDSDQTKPYLRFVQITHAVEHTVNLIHFRRLAEKVESKLHSKVGIDIVLVSPVNFRGRNPTKIKVKNEAALSAFAIASNAGKRWTPEEVEGSVTKLFFIRQHG